MFIIYFILLSLSYPLFRMYVLLRVCEREREKAGDTENDPLISSNDPLILLDSSGRGVGARSSGAVRCMHSRCVTNRARPRRRTLPARSPFPRADTPGKLFASRGAVFNLHSCNHPLFCIYSVSHAIVSSCSSCPPSRRVAVVSFPLLTCLFN